MANSKIVFGGTVLIDLTADTVEPEVLLKGVTAHGADGEPIVGTCSYDSDTNDATVKVAEMLDGKTAYARGAKIVGTMPNKGAVSGSISKKDETFSIPQGYHDGGGIVGISETEKAKLIPSNIRQGVKILNVEGSMTATEGVNAQSVMVTPSMEVQTVMPGEGYNYLAQVTVKPIPYVEAPNSAGGVTVTIG